MARRALRTTTTAAALTVGGLVALAAGRATATAVAIPAPPAPPAAGPVAPMPNCVPEGSQDRICQLVSKLSAIAGAPALLGAIPSRVLGGHPPAPDRTSGGPPPTVTVPPSETTPNRWMDEATLQYSSAPFLEDLLDILAHPLGTRRPDLQHFRAQSDDGRTVVRTGDNPQPAIAGHTPHDAHDDLLLALRVLAPTLLGIVLIVGWRRPGEEPRLVHPAGSLSRRLKACGTLGGAVATVAAASFGAALVLPEHGAGSVTALSALSFPAGQVREHLDSRPAALTVWNRLLVLEASLADAQDRLAVLEAEFRRLLGTDLQPVGLDRLALSTTRLSRLVAAHDAARAAYLANVQTEYALYQEAADAPRLRDELIAGAAGNPDPAVAGAVARNLQLLQTQLAQERAIATASARLAQWDSPAASDLQGMVQHQELNPPESAPLSQAFGPTDFSLEPPFTYHGVFYPHFHTGIDLAAPLDTPLHAAADGVVLLAASSLDARGHLVGYGNYVVIAHPGNVVTLYGHLDRLLVTAGQVVGQGQVIGLEGSTGWSTGPHVHFEVRQGRELLDPLPLVMRPAPSESSPPMGG
jgi:murein DD-endopeptidase MepM/ murein hydrolase activator NlpD